MKKWLQNLFNKIADYLEAGKIEPFRRRVYRSEYDMYISYPEKFQSTRFKRADDPKPFGENSNRVLGISIKSDYCPMCGEYNSCNMQ